MHPWKIAGISFDHMHMGDLLRQVHQHPRAEICGISDDNPANAKSVRSAIDNFRISAERVYTDYRALLEATRPDIVVLCSATAQHGEWVEKIAPYGTHVLVEKPFAATLEEADHMIAAMQASGKNLVINWPLAWYPAHVTAKRFVDEGVIGDVLEVHYYDGNPGPMSHVTDHEDAREVARAKSRSWFYQKDKGGGSLQDYLGYGTTLGTWFQGNRAPLEVTSMTHVPPGLEVDEHSITIARYAHGLSKFETRWGTLTSPWQAQPQPKCGFVLVGTKGTISSYDYQTTIRIQTATNPEGEDVPVDEQLAPHRNPIEYLIHCLESGEEVSGPLSPQVSRIGQQIVDSAVLSAQQNRTVALVL